MSGVTAASLNGVRTQQLASARDASARRALIEALALELSQLPPDNPEYARLLVFLSRQLILSPFDDVRAYIPTLLDKLSIAPIEINPSRWTECPVPSASTCRSINPASAMGNLEWLLCQQPQLAKNVLSTLDVLMDSEGPLPTPWRHYIAILASSRFSCEYLVFRHIEKFLLSGGDPRWLDGAAPAKLRALSSLNVRLAHSPWTVEASHLEQTIRDGRWSTAELCHALSILTTFHCLPAVVFALGTDSDAAIPLVESEPGWDPQEVLPSCYSDPVKNSVLARIREGGLTESIGGSADTAFEGFGALREERSTQSAKMLSATEKRDLQAAMTLSPILITPLSDSFRGGDHTAYEDIKVKQDRLLHTVSFSWDDHALVVLSQGYEAGAEAIGSEHALVREFTNGKIGDIQAETKPIREALAKYVQRMFGVCHDDYPYEQLNKVLPLMHKVVLKKMACFPERLNKADFMRMLYCEQFSHEDLTHYAIIVFETRRVIELTFAMQALAKMQAT